MNLIKRKKNKNYTTISNIFLRDERLSLKAKGLMAVIMSLPDDWEFTINGICAILKEGKEAVYNSIKELKEYGYCSAERQHDARGRIAGNDYTFYEMPRQDQPHTAYPHTGKPYMDNPHTDNPHTENPPQINKDIIKERIEERKNKQNKELNNSPTSQIYEAEEVSQDDILFSRLVQEYKGGANIFAAKEEWNLLTAEEKQAVAKHLPKYNDSNDPKYLKNFENYLKFKQWTYKEASNERANSSQEQMGGSNSSNRKNSFRNNADKRREEYRVLGEVCRSVLSNNSTEEI